MWYYLEYLVSFELHLLPLFTLYECLLILSAPVTNANFPPAHKHTCQCCVYAPGPGFWGHGKLQSQSAPSPKPPLSPPSPSRRDYRSTMPT